MQTISQVAELTGVSVRALQYYDEIELLKPSELTQSGYRLYDDEALQKLQQIHVCRTKEIDIFQGIISRTIDTRNKLGNNVIIMENAKMICNGQKNLERIAYTNYIISINIAYNNVNTVC